MGSSETGTVHALSISSYGLTPCVHGFISPIPSVGVLGRFSNPALSYIHHGPGTGQPCVLLSVQAVGLKYKANLPLLKLWLWRDPGKAVMCLTFVFGPSGSCFDVLLGWVFFGGREGFLSFVCLLFILLLFSFLPPPGYFNLGSVP